MKVLILGGFGLLGSEIYEQLLENRVEVFRFRKNEMNLLDRSTLEKINEIQPNIIIHAAGFTNVEESENDILQALDVNCRGLYNLLSVTKEKEIPILFFSTDYIFDGTQKVPYSENQIAIPLNNYGLTKLLAEDILRASYCKYYIIRTSWLFGEKGHCFPKTIINKYKETQYLEIVNDQVGSPTYTRDLAKSVIQLLKKELPYGTYNISNRGEVSWYQFAKLILEKYGIKNPHLKPINTDLNKIKAKRPYYSVLSNEKINKFGIINRPYECALEEYIENLED